MDDRILFTGCGRSGTRFTYYVLSRGLGFSVCFECPDEHQHLVSWCDGLRPDLPYTYCVAQIRNPYLVLSSLWLSKPQSWGWADASLRRDTELPGLRQPYEKNRKWNAVALYAQWYTALLPMADFIFRIEDAAVALPMLFSGQFGESWDTVADAVSGVRTTCNTVPREKMFVTKTEIEEWCPEYAPTIALLAQRFGYKEPSCESSAS